LSRLRGREILAAGSFFALASIVFTWPLAARLPNGMPDLWDDKLNAWIFHWDFHQFFRDPLKLFDANIFYPAHGTLAFSENLFGAAVFGFPLFAAGASTLVTANVLMLLGMTLSGIGAWALARHVTLDPAASLVAGIVYAFVPWRIAQLPHVQFQWGAFLALLLLFLLRSLESGRARDAALFGLFFAWNALTNVHYALFSGFLVALVLAHAALTYDRPIFLRRARSIVFAGAIACVLVLPFYLPYVRASRTYGMVRGEGEIESYSGRPIDFLTAGPQNKLYAPLTQKWGHGEGDFFPGLTALALAIFALVHLRGSAPERAARVSMRRRHAARVLDVAIAAALLLALAAAVFHRTAIGPIKVRDPGRIVAIVGLVAIVRLVIAFPSWSRFADLSDFARRARVGSRATLFSSIAALGVLVALGTHTPFYRILVQSFGSVFRAIRVPGRGIVLFDLALGVLAAWGLALATSAWRPRARLAALGLALLLITVEYRAFPIDIGDVPERPAPVYRWLATVPLRGAVVEWPLGFEFDPEHVFRSTAHWKPLVNGYSGFAPPAYNALHGLLDGRRIPDTVWNAMRRLGGSVLLFHPTEMRDETVRAHADVLRRGLREGRIAPLGAFSRPGEETPDLAFRLAGAPPFRVEVPASQALASLADALLLIDRIETRRTAPFGVIDHPAENGEVMAGYWAFGWALDDSGVAGVALHADGDAPVDCAVHAAYPGVAALYGAYPESKSPGFGCPVPRLAPGRHLLSFEVTARDGGKTVLTRAVFVRAGG
jgi:hypothetical protein